MPWTVNRSTDRLHEPKFYIVSGLWSNLGVNLHIRILLAFFICIISTGTCGCGDSNESPTPKPNVVSQSPALHVTASTFCSDYQNTISGDGKYKDKVISVSGEVTMVDKPFGHPMVNLFGGGPTVDCTFDTSQESSLAKIKAGQNVTIKGRCTGESLSSPQLEDCVLQ